jgi:L-fuculose-phosphate aldolase
MSRDDPRSELIAVAQALDAAGLVPNKSGNVSCRAPTGFLITPAGMPYADLEPAMLAALRLDGEPESPGPRPSSEWRMHAAVYAARPEVQGIVHTHSPQATALACAGHGIPAFHYMIALAGGDVRCAPYSTFGTADLADAAVRGLEGRRATLLSNHGVLAVGASLGAAYAVALEVENLASQYLALLAAGLEPRVLDEAELARVIEKFQDYGRLARS